MACCPSINPNDLANYTAALTCCTLTLTDSVTGDVPFELRLDQTIVLVIDGIVKIRDGMSTFNIPIADLATLGYTAQDIRDAADACRCGIDDTIRATDFYATVLHGCYYQDIDPAIIGSIHVIRRQDSTIERYEFHAPTLAAPVSLPDLTKVVLTACSENSESLVLNPYCDDVTGDLTGYDAILVDENDNTIQTLYFDANKVQVATPPTGSPCAGELTVNCPTC